MQKKILIAGVAMVILGGGMAFVANTKLENKPSDVPTDPVPEDDGIGEGVSGAEHDTEIVEVKLGESVPVRSTTIKVLEIVEDSRCPTDAQCIQAGTVRIRVYVGNENYDYEAVMNLGDYMTTEAQKITFANVTPAPVSGREISPTEYRFIFEAADHVNYR